MFRLSPSTVNTILYCREWAATVAFYRDQLGFPITYVIGWFVEFAPTPTTRLSIADERRTTIKSAHGQGITLTFQVTDADAVWGELYATGLQPTPCQDHAWGARVFYLYDPEGHRIEIWSPKPA
jgi:catechol 2,3-dioxygenase-like lactoylglutathione lyase family enzyme